MLLRIFAPSKPRLSERRAEKNSSYSERERLRTKFKRKNDTIMEAKKTKEEALEFIKNAVRHKQEWRKELEAEFKGKDVNVVFL